MKLLKSFLLYLVLFVVIIIIANYSSVYFAEFVDDYFGLNWAGGWLDISDILGLMIGYIFFTSFFISLFGSIKKYWVLGFLLVPLLFLELLDGDFILLGVSILFAIVGWGLGLGILALYNKLFKRQSA